MTGARFRRIGGYLLNAVTDVPDQRDYPYEPALIRLKRQMAPGRPLGTLDQRHEGACTGFGLAAVIDILNRRRGRRYRVSPRMLYEMARKYDEWPGEAYSGSSCRGAILGWYTMGVCRETQWRYAPGEPGLLTVERAKQARENTLGVYYRVSHRLSHFHAALNEVGALFVSANVHPGWRASEVRDGAIPFRRGSLGGHAFAIVGYDADGFWVQNSWGPDWGRGGIAQWSYEDWQANIRDAWVFRMGLPSPKIWPLPPNAYSTRLDDPQQLGRSPARAEIAGHFVHLDDGRLQPAGRYWSTLADVEQTARLLAESDKYDYWLIYAHGGLNSPKASARRISAMKEVFKDNRVYPFHFMYDTGLTEEIRDALLRRDREVAERVGGFTEWTDTLLERSARPAGRALWREMKSGARSPFGDGCDGTLVVKTFLDEFAATGKPKKIHVVGHSTGGILLAYLLEALQTLAPAGRVAGCHLLAPAATVDLFRSHYYPLLAADRREFGIDKMTIYNLSDRLETRDNVACVYRKSLLYLVSRAFEEATPAPLLGMQIYSDELAGRVPGGRLELVFSKGRNGAETRCTSESHGGFDNDVATMNDLLAAIVGKRPARPFADRDLAY